jgi:hypothetical protein
VDEAVERGAVLEDDDVIQRATVELDVGEVLARPMIGDEFTELQRTLTVATACNRRSPSQRVEL